MDSRNKRERDEDAAEEDEEEPFPLLPITSDATVVKCRTLPLRSTDVFVASYPKSGTTWMQHIVHTLATDGNSPLPHVSDACPFYEVDRTWASGTDAVLAPSVIANHDKLGRRIFNTHLRWAMMPKSHDGARYVYLTRRPVDACVSFYHHLVHQAASDGGFEGTFAEFATEWTGGRAPFGSWSAHLRSWMGADGMSGGAADARVLVVSYEALRSDLKGQVRRIHDHCQLSLSEERLDALLPRFTFEWMREHEAQFNPRSVTWVAPNRTDGAADDPKPEQTFHFIRAGRSGDGDEPFANEARRKALAQMVRRTFPASVPEYVAKLLPADHS